jgi:cobalt/nickel transport system permease protein
LKPDLLFDRYQAGASPIHRLEPRIKVLATLLFILSNALLPDGAWLAYLAAWGLVLVITRLAQLELGYAVRRSVVALPFALAALSVVVNLPGQPLAVWSIGSWQLVPTDAGLIRFLSIVVRSLLSVQMAILLTATTAVPDLLHALRHLRLPDLLVSIVAFMLRYLVVLVDEAQRLLRAREARSARPADGGGGGSLFWRARVTGNMAGQLFLRSYDRSERVYQAMVARGYRGQLRTLHPHELRRRDWLALGLVGVGLVLVQLIGRVGGL